MNSWGDAAVRVPERITVLRYEDLQATTEAELTRVALHFQLDLSAAAIAHGVAQSDKRSMAARDDPNRPPGAVRVGGEDRDPEYTAEDHAFIAAASRRCLRHDFGYDYSRPSAATASATASVARCKASTV